MKNPQFEIKIDTEFPLAFSYQLKTPIYPIKFGTLHSMNHLFIDNKKNKQVLFGIKHNFRIDFIQKGLAIELFGGLDGFHKYQKEINILQEWLISEFTPELVPADDLYVIRKDFVSEIYPVKLYSRYSIIQKYKCKNFDEFWKMVSKLFPKNFVVEKQFLYMELMFGSSDRDEPKSYAGISLRNEKYFKKYLIYKIGYDSLINKRKLFIVRAKNRTKNAVQK